MTDWEIQKLTVIKSYFNFSRGAAVSFRNITSFFVKTYFNGKSMVRITEQNGSTKTTWTDTFADEEIRSFESEYRKWQHNGGQLRDFDLMQAAYKLTQPELPRFTKPKGSKR